MCAEAGTWMHDILEEGPAVVLWLVSINYLYGQGGVAAQQVFQGSTKEQARFTVPVSRQLLIGNAQQTQTTKKFIIQTATPRALPAGSSPTGGAQPTHDRSRGAEEPLPEVHNVPDEPAVVTCRRGIAEAHEGVKVRE